MKPRSFILRCTAFVLILAFSQKTGAGLLFHNLFHTSQASDKFPSKQKGAKDINFACNCLDDFLMPFIEEEEPLVVKAVAEYPAVAEFLQKDIPFYARTFSSLRGPPSYML